MSFIAVKMDKMKNVQYFMLNFPKKPCWKKLLNFWFKTFNSLGSCHANQNKSFACDLCTLIHRQEAKPAKCLKLKLLITFFSKLFRKNGNIKCYTAYNSEHFLFYPFSLQSNSKLSYWIFRLTLALQINRAFEWF